MEIIPGDEDHALALALARSLVEAVHTNGVERFDDPRPWREISHDLAGADTAQVGKNEPGASLDKRIGGIDEDTTVPLGKPLQGRLDILPRHGARSRSA